MTNKQKIKEVIVVEGKTDADKILSLFDARIITTNGSDCSDETIAMIEKANKASGVILFLDPDYVGEQIRKKIMAKVPNTKQAFIDSNDIVKNKKNKIGIAEASNKAIVAAMNKLVTFENNSNTISLFEYNKLKLDNKIARIKVCEHYHISYCNNKQLLKRLNMMGVTYNDINSWLAYENKK